MARSADKTESYISMVLGLNGRVRPADLQAIPPEARSEALRTFAEKHGAEIELHFEGEALVAGAQPSASAPAAVVAPLPELGTDAPPAAAPLASETPASASSPTDLTSDGESAIDLLLGDYDGAPAPVAASVLLAPDAEASAVAPAAVGAVGAASPAASGEPGVGAAVSPAAVAHVAPAAPRDTSRGWMLWWIPTLLVPVIGGAAAWFFLRRTRVFAARAMLTTALAVGLLGSIVWLRYAEQLAATAEQRAAEKVIVLPSK